MDGDQIVVQTFKQNEKYTRWEKREQRGKNWQLSVLQGMELLSWESIFYNQMEERSKIQVNSQIRFTKNRDSG